MMLLNNPNKNLKEKLNILISDCKRFDITIESILDEEYNNIKIFVDNLICPTIVEIIQGTFVIFAGDADSDVSMEIVKKIPPHYGIQPTNEKWVALAKKIHKENLKSSKRFIFSSANLSKKYLEEIIDSNKFSEFLKRIDLDTASKMSKDKLQKCHFFNYDSAEDFIRKSFGFCVEKDKEILAACTACLLSKKSAEISIITNPKFRKKGLATLVAAKFILYCLEHNLTPHWDAANYPSYLLAKKLGYDYIDEYDILYIDN